MSTTITLQGARPLEASDARTLSYATPPLTAELLAQWIRGQETFLASLEADHARGEGREAALASAHRRASEVSELSTQVNAQVETVVRAFCGVLQTVEALRRKVTSLEQTAPSDDATAAQIARIRGETERLLVLTPLIQRHGEEAIAALRAEQERLLALHIRWSEALGH